MKRNPWSIVFSLIGLFFLFVMIAFAAAIYTAFSEKEAKVERNSVLVLDVKGVIVDGKAFIKNLNKYKDDKDIKAIVVRIDSPGGVVGPSQEMYDAIMAVKELKKPVVASMGSVAASGGYYVAAACDKIVTNPGTITGSIGVIMEFANLSGLYQWAKVERYVIKSGAYKDVGSEFRAMTPDERNLVQTMMDNVHKQFKKAVSLGRKMDMAKVDKYGDGRIFSGEQAVELGFADELGGLAEAVKIAGKLGKIQGEPEIFYPKPGKKLWLQKLLEQQDDEDEYYQKFANKILGLDLLGKPLYLMMGYY